MRAKLRERDLGRHRCRWGVNSEAGLIKIMSIYRLEYFREG